MNQRYTFFWGGPFSQWYPSSFTDEDGTTFNCAEQYMMYHKALVFGDQQMAMKIMATDNPKVQKSLGRRVRGFDAKVWYGVAYQIVYRGNFLKFSQNETLKNKLLDTAGTLLVEASPYDAIWGIGFDAERALTVPTDRWGQNLLGKALTELRDEFLEN